MNQIPKPTIGILHCGEMGAAMAAALVENGLPVVTTVAGRSPDTQDRAVKSGARLLESVNAVVEASDIIFSLVTPDAACQTISECGNACLGTPAAQEKIFVDVNSIELSRLTKIAQDANHAGFHFVDATIHGTAKQLVTRGIVYLSGDKASDVADVLSTCLRTRVIGDAPHLATQMKLLLGAQTKCISMLMLELFTVAQQANLLEPFLEESGQFYPELLAFLERSLPTYVTHATRRVSELKGAEELAANQHCDAPILASARLALEQFKAYADQLRESPATTHDLRTLIHQIAALKPDSTE